MKTAIIHYWLTGMGGGEKVLEALCRIWPEADIYTHAVDRNAISPFLAQRSIRTTFIQSLPFAHKKHRFYLPLMPLALEQLDLRAYDLVVSSESGPAKGALTRADTAHICYCHSPMRYLWDFYQDYLESAGAIARFFMRPAFHYLRMWDTASAARVDAFAANSRCVAARIRKHWRREAQVIPPPVAVEAVAAAGSAPECVRLREKEGPFYLCAGRLVAYKRVDIAIAACAARKRKLIVVGDGEERKRLEDMADAYGAREWVRFAGRQETDALYAYYHACEAFLFPGEEDFGITPVEAMAAGKPVLAFGRGGVLDSVRDGESGVLFPEQNAASLQAAMARFEAMRGAFEPDAIRAHAGRFAERRFLKDFSELAERTLQAVRAPLSF